MSNIHYIEVPKLGRKKINSGHFNLRMIFHHFKVAYNACV